MKNKLSITHFTQQQRQDTINKIIAFFLDERDEEIGTIAATEILEFIESEISPITYKKAMEDSKKIVEEQHQHMLLKLTENTLD